MTFITNGCLFIPLKAEMNAKALCCTTLILKVLQWNICPVRGAVWHYLTVTWSIYTITILNHIVCHTRRRTHKISWDVEAELLYKRIFSVTAEIKVTLKVTSSTASLYMSVSEFNILHRILTLFKPCIGPVQSLIMYTVLLVILRAMLLSQM